MRVRIVIPSLFFGLLAVCALQSSPSRVPVVAILLHSSAGIENLSLRALIVDAITVELQARAAAAVSYDDAPGASPDVFSIADKTSADFVISGTYALADHDVDLALTWVDVGQRKTFPEVRTSGPLDLSFDSVVSNAVGKLLDGHEQRLTSLPPRPASAAPTRPPAVVAAVTPAPGAPVETRKSLSVGLPKARQLSFSVGSAPFIPVFKATAYVPTVGLSISAEGEYRFPIGTGLVGIVAASGLHYFHAERTSVADAFVIPIAAGAVYRTVTGSIVDFAIRAEAGPAVFVLSPAGGETSVGVVPFFSSGLGATLNFSTLLAASIDLDYVAILVPDAIMGFVPSVALDVRL